MRRRVRRAAGSLLVAFGALAAGGCSSSKAIVIRSSDAVDATAERVVSRPDGADATTVDGTTVDRTTDATTMIDADAEGRPSIDAVGTCGALPLGAPAPPGACPTTAPASCGLDGTCDGAGGCHRYPAGTLCAAPICADSVTFQPPSVCDGQGTCVASLPVTCSPYTCVGGACQVDDCKFNPADCVAPRNRDASPD